MNVDTTQTAHASLPRLSGILLHPTSFPSAYGIGDLGAEAYHFVDFLASAGQHLWQILPLTHTGFGDSPYQSFSAFAGQPLLISLDSLVTLDLLEATDLENCPTSHPSIVDYGQIIPWKEAILRKAFQRFTLGINEDFKKEYDTFLEDNFFWLQDYSLFLTIKNLNQGRSWLEWEPSYRTPSAALKEEVGLEHQGEVNYYRFVQFVFFKQWLELKKYANEKEIQIIGDIPIFVSMDSADVWANQSLFQLDSKGFPTNVAGVPPDYFCATGQLWGNPLYDWEEHKEQGYSWWISRLRNQLQLLDYLRIDHFRGFEAYWAVPYGEETAINGTWLPGPGADFFNAISNELGSQLPIIAEDLGLITPEVESLRDQFHFPGMKVLQFAFEDTSESTFLPHRFTTTNCICYTGTHDNDTVCGWYETAPEEAKNKVRLYMNTNGNNIQWDFIRTCLGTIAAFAIFPLQDVLGIGKDGRMNRPGEAMGNWSWRYQKDLLNEGTAEYLKTLTRVYGR
ncbi:4-alpha-glucanotransferase [Lachnospiraceae bacterium OttesenSCG-928-E19]|nr:4-alpha-glucanotransferase [Lachnospiraceae bacterium OttesenSCG-928-E19]